MAELRPYPFASLIRRMLHELKHSDGIFDLPRRKFFLGAADKDLGVSFHGRRASSVLGPAAGPQTQMAQNLVLSWLSGCRIMELKTVQVNDRLDIPRPCIDMQTLGYNVEWSQELRLQESLEEYVKGSMLIEILCASGELDVGPGYGDVLFDMSVGYDLAGIQSDTVQAFMDGMMDCSVIVDRLRKQIPDEFKAYRDLDFMTALSDTLTLSTFHGCPPDEIEKIIEFLLRDKGLHCIAKLNPTLLGAEDARNLMAELGYKDIRIPDSAFANDTRWQQAVDFVERLGAQADELGLGFGVKFSNTLLVDNHREFFPKAEKAMYLSGPPLHVLAINLVGRFREQFGDRFPISFSAGIDRNNFSDVVALGLVPVTVCSDLLKPGGYGRASGYLAELCKRMDQVGATDIDDYVLRAFGNADKALDTFGMDDAQGLRACREALVNGGDLRQAAGENYGAWLSKAKLLNTEQYVTACTENPRYGLEKNSKVPKKVGSSLELFDCVSCNKCVPVCPNDANFVFVIPPRVQDIVKFTKGDSGWETRIDGQLKIAKKVQYGTFADFCNECGNCDVFCPEDGGPYVVKSRFFGSHHDWSQLSTHDGFFFDPGDLGRSYARFSGKEFVVETEANGRTRYSGNGFNVTFEADTPADTIEGDAEVEVDLGYYYIVNWIRQAVLKSESNNYLRHL